MEKSDRGLAALERIRNIKGTSGTGRGVNLIKVDQTTQDLVLGSFFSNPAIEQAARELRDERKLAPITADTTPDDADAPAIDDDTDEQRVARRLLTQQVEGIGDLQNTQPAEYTGLQRDPVVVLQGCLPEDPILELADRRAKEKGLSSDFILLL
jgi:hypothetical protein